MATMVANPKSDAEIRDRFRRLASDWKQQSLLMSNPAQMAMLKSYQQIIGMGPAVLPFILEELLSHEPNHWF